MYKGIMYLQITQAAIRLGCSRQWVHELINRGKLVTAEIAGRRLIVCDDAFMQMCRDRQKQQQAKAA